jgi:carboxyl-terminal processing protease
MRTILLIIVVGLSLAGTSFAQEQKASPEADDAYVELELFTDALAVIQRNYVEKVDLHSLIYGGIRGMLQTLDPHSSFLTPELYQEMQADTQGEFGGVGIEVTLEKDALLVVAPLDGTPAQRAGIKARDQIVSINDHPTQNLDLMQAVNMMRGQVGEKITLGILRPGVEGRLDFELIREVIQLHSVSARTLEPGYAYARVRQFQERTAIELQQQLQQVRAENNNRLKGLILDLRDNPGGLLDQAVAVSDLFLAEGLIVYTQGRDPADQLRFEAGAEQTEPDYPLILLINEGSASASEIVAGALHDHARAMLLGEKTFGKGSVQTIIPLSDDSGLRLTTARYFTPSGTSIQVRGIEPDIAVPPLHLPENKSQGHYREVDLQNHFAPQAQPETVPVLPRLSAEDQMDYQLMRALDLLKGLDHFGVTTYKAAE